MRTKGEVAVREVHWLRIKASRTLNVPALPEVFEVACVREGELGGGELHNIVVAQPPGVICEVRRASPHAGTGHARISHRVFLVHQLQAADAAIR